LPDLEVVAEGGVLRLTLNRPEVYNALTGEMADEVATVIEGATGRDDVRVIVLTGTGSAFSTGADISGAEAHEGFDVTALDRANRIVRAIVRVDKPVVAAVNGVAAGAGCNFALAADIVLAARSATFVEAFARIGLIHDVGGTFFLPRLVGFARARGMAMLADAITAEQAEQWGLIWKMHDDNKLMGEAHALCERLAKAPTYALGLTKRALDASVGNDLDAQLQLEYELQKLAGSSSDYAEGVRAFIEKRKPNFTGKKPA